MPQNTKCLRVSEGEAPQDLMADILADIEARAEREKLQANGKNAAYAEKPSRLPKKIRNGGEESYHPFHRRK